MSQPASRRNTNPPAQRSQLRVLHDKTSYGILPTQSSPPPSSSFSPALTQSGSNSSSSPPQPTTPPASTRSGTSRTRYGDIGRVPLHRRGTSNTYERLEDLLKEAGYKETRIFTPETERVAEAARGKEADTRLDGTGGAEKASLGGKVAGFFAGLIPGTATTTNVADPIAEDPRAILKGYSPPESPLTRRGSKQMQRPATPSRNRPSSPTSTSSVDGLAPTPKPRRSTTPLQRSPSYQHQHSLRIPQEQTLTHRASHHSPHLPHATSRTSLYSQYSHVSQTQSQRRHPRASAARHPSPLLPAAPPQASSSATGLAHPQPSRAGAYLRHMASIPSIPKRPSSTPSTGWLARSSRLISDNEDDDDDGSTYGTQQIRRGDGEGEDTARLSSIAPPLPQSWLESVARAVLFGGYAGGPNAHASGDEGMKSLKKSTPELQTPALRHTRSLVARSQTKGKSPALQRSASGLAPPGAKPEFMLRVGRGRSGESVGEVSRARVVCRSAPVSRDSSRTRGSPSKGRSGPERREMARGASASHKGRERGRKQKGKESAGVVPSLARTRVEDDDADIWVERPANSTVKAKSTQGRSGGGGVGNRFLTGWGADSADDGSVDDRSSSSEEEGELDLARMLVPPKRQNSIRSLRRHLTGDGTPGTSTASASLMRVASGRKPPSAFGSGNSRMFKRWGAPPAGEWDDEEERGESAGGAAPWLWSSRKEPIRRASQEEDEGDFLGFLERNGRLGSGSGRGTGKSTASSNGKGRLGLPLPWAGASGEAS